MNNRNSAWSIPAGTWFGVSVQVSLLFLLIIPAFCIHLGGVRTGLTFSLILFLSVLLHEFMHVLAARLTGGFGDTVQITPFGGLAMCHPAPTLSSQLWTPASGPLSNLALCLITAVPLWQLGDLWSAFNPFEFPEVSLSGHGLLPGLTMLVFKANWLLVLINLIPVHPLDGGRILLTWLSHRMDGVRGRDIYVRTGSIAGALVVLAGLLLSALARGLVAFRPTLRSYISYRILQALSMAPFQMALSCMLSDVYGRGSETLLRVTSCLK